MKKKHVIILVVFIIIVGSILAVTGVKSYIESNLEKLADLTIANVDVSKAKDGIYSGSYKAFPVEAEVKVIINNNRIAGIELVKHNNGQGVSAEIISDMVVQSQTLEVDVVSGATYSSKVILKAIEAALNKANK